MTDGAESPRAGVPPCPLCSDTDSVHLRLVKQGHRVHTCRSCRLHFVHPQPSPTQLADIYDSGYFQRGNKYADARPDRDPNRRNDDAKIALLRREGAGRRLLDVGCGMGGFLRAARDADFDVEGMEISAEAATFVSSHCGISVHQGVNSLDSISGSTFDVVTFWDVIEHLPQPMEALSTAHRLLRPGGLLALSTGDASSVWARMLGKRWPLLTPPQHLFFFTPHSLRALFQRCGFEPVHCCHRGKWTSLDFAAFKAEEAFGRIVSPLRRGVQSLRIGQRMLYVNLRDIVITLGVKRSPAT